jgi:hypothetical protein
MDTSKRQAYPKHIILKFNYLVTKGTLWILIGLCILLRVYQSISIETSVRNKC